MVAFQELLQRLEASVEFLADKPEETATSTLRALWFTAAGEPRSAESAAEGELPALDAAGTTALHALLERRTGGEPLAHITARQRFMDIEMLAGASALVPRKETELLAGSALAFVQAALSHAAAPLMVDACTGSGNIALAVARRFPAARVVAADLSAAAVELARANAQFTGLADRVEFRTGDLLHPFETPDILGKVDVLACNPPYISTGKVKQLTSEIGDHEPSLAFDGGPFGVGILMRLLTDAPALLRPGGWLTFEIGLGQGPGLIKRMGNMPAYKQVETTLDRAGDIRVVSARC